MDGWMGWSGNFFFFEEKYWSKNFSKGFPLQVGADAWKPVAGEQTAWAQYVQDQAQYVQDQVQYVQDQPQFLEGLGTVRAKLAQVIDPSLSRVNKKILGKVNNISRKV